jgi:hypothetical protein
MADQASNLGIATAMVKASMQASALEVQLSDQH